VLIVSQNGRIEDLNPGAEAIFGYSRDEILSDPSIQLVAGDSPADFRAKMLETVRREGSWSGELTCMRKDGNEIVLESHIVPMTGDDAEVTGFVAVNRDISARVAFEESLKQAKLDAEVANRAKSGFLATMSHEIRTPMNGVMGMANLLLDTELDEAQRQYAEVIMTSGNALLDLINDILDVSKLEAGRVDLTEEEFNPLEVIENARNLMKPRADEKGIALNALVQPGMPTCLIGDPGRLRQILLNLIGNAIKFTGDGAVSLNASVSRPQNGQVELRFEVTDTGIGIPEDVRGRLFERFVQADASTTSQFGGTGLGLAICRELCHLMDGEIGVDSVEGEGSTFWFTVRLAVVGAMPVGEDTTIERMPEMADNNTAPDGAELPLVLLAEDNEVNQLVAVATLTKLGYRTEVVENGEQAVEAVKTRRFAAVIMDLQMPVMDGLQATQMIRALDDAQASIPIIALTADAMKGDRERCLAAGIDDYLTKPLDKAQLDETLQRIIADARSDAA
jgi:PAS domain S-box-containing protein